MPAVASHLPALLRLADVAVDGGIARYIEGHRKERRSWAWIARQLWADTGGEIEVTATTLAKWARLLEEEAAA